MTGTMVQKYGNALIITGGRSGLCDHKVDTVEDKRSLLTFKVTILPPCSTIMLYFLFSSFLIRDKL